MNDGGIYDITTVGQSGKVVTCRTALCDPPGSNPTIGSCVYHDSHCDKQP